jgi:CDP-diacylglycerol--serine O-phosphatidyltransferase
VSAGLRLAAASALTLGNAGCGFAAVLALMLAGPPAIPAAAALVFGAWLFDTVDGMAARKLGVSGPFGAVLDTVCDVVSFGLVPALLVVTAAGGSAPAIAAAAAYLAGALLRLARYTAHALTGSVGDGRLWFQGLSSPAAAMAVAAAVLALSDGRAALAALVAAPLMVSRIGYPDLTKFYLQRRLPLWTLLLPPAGLLLTDLKGVLLGVFALYLAGSPFLPRGRG